MSGGARAVERVPTSTKRFQDRPVVIPAAGIGNPWINFDDGRSLEVRFADGAEAADRFQLTLGEGRVEPLTLASADFDEDGVPDLACGYSIGETGLISLHRGNKDPIYPHSERSRERRLEGTFLNDPFFPEARLLHLPAAPDLLGAGDFDGDRHWDLVLATRGDNRLWYLPGRGDGTFDQAQAVALAGDVTVFLVADLNRRDLRADIVVGLINEEGPRLLVFQTPWGALDRTHGMPPEELLVDSIPSALAAEDLDGDYRIDLAVGHGDSVTVFFGRDRKLLWPEPVRDQVESAREENIFFDAPVRSLAIGDFAGDRRPELAVLTQDEPFFIGREDEGVWTRRSLGREDRSYGVEAQLLRARVSTLPKDDLLILDPERRRIEIRGEVSRGERRILPNSFPDRTIRSWIRSVDAPVSVLPMRFNADALTDLVLLTDSPDPLSFLVTQGNEPIVVDTDGSESSLQNDDKCDADADPENGEQCTLPEAIRTANNRGGLDTIQFAISQINLTERLPDIFDPVVIDGTSAGLVTLTPIERFASGLLDLGANASGSTIRGMKTNVKITGGSNNIVEGNQLGVSTGGADIEPAVLIRGGESSNNLIGGTTAEARNILIGGDLAVGGVEIGSNFTSSRDDTTRTMIFGNYIGTDATGTRVSGFGAGVFIFPPNSDNQIGGLAPGQGNLIAGSEGRGVLLARQTSDNIVAGNKIGTDPTGTFTNPDRFSGECPDRTSSCSPTRLGNRLTGVAAEGNGNDHQVVENLISGNGHSEIFRPNGVGTGSDGTIIRDNQIGTDISGTKIDPDGVPENGDELGNGVGISVSGTGVMVTGNVIAGNAREGIRVSQTLGPENDILIQDNQVGLGAGGQRLGNGGDGVYLMGSGRVNQNRIAFNALSGVKVRGEDTTAPLTRNQIWENGELGIDLVKNGEFPTSVTPNDPGDVDTDGPNGLQNFPVLNGADGFFVTGRLDADPGTDEEPKTYTIEFFANTACDDSQVDEEGKPHGEGETFLRVVENVSPGEFTFPLPVAEGLFVTATATSEQEGNTSEFSICVPVLAICPAQSQCESPIIVNSTRDGEDDNQGDEVCSTGKKVTDSSQDCDPTVGGDCECTLRAAIMQANVDPSKSTIRFLEEVFPEDSPGVIFPKESLPEIEHPVIIDASGAGVVIDGSRAGNSSTGLKISAGNSTVKGLTIVGFRAAFFGIGIEIEKEGGNRIEGNTLIENTRGLAIGSDDNRIGGVNTAQSCLDPCNLISGNGSGIGITGDRNIVQGNFIGTDSTGTQKRGNEFLGITILGGLGGGRKNEIGGTRRGEGNLISGNRGGIRIGAPDNTIQGNRIGTDRGGTENLVHKFLNTLTYYIRLIWHCGNLKGVPQCLDTARIRSFYRQVRKENYWLVPENIRYRIFRYSEPR